VRPVKAQSDGKLLVAGKRKGKGTKVSGFSKNWESRFLWVPKGGGNLFKWGNQPLGTKGLGGWTYLGKKRVKGEDLFSKLGTGYRNLGGPTEVQRTDTGGGMTTASNNPNKMGGHHSLENCRHSVVNSGGSGGPSNERAHRLCERNILKEM